jgi:hypothetical protein
MLNVEIYWNICHNGSGTESVKDFKLPFCPVPGMKYQTRVGPDSVVIKEVLIEEEGDAVRVYLEDLHVETEEIQDKLLKQLTDRGWI